MQPDHHPTQDPPSPHVLRALVLLAELERARAVQVSEERRRLSNRVEVDGRQKRPRSGCNPLTAGA